MIALFRLGVICLLGLVCVACAGTAGAGPGTCPAGRALSELRFPGRFEAAASPVRFELVSEGGREWLSAHTDGTGKLGIASSTPLSKGIDLSGDFLRFQLRLRGAGRIGGMELRLGSGERGNDAFVFTIPLFTDPLFDPLQPDAWIPITLSFGRARSDGRPDRSRIRWISWLLRDDGRAPIEVSLADLEVVPEPAQGVLSFTFDDGYDEHFEAAKRMGRHGFQGTAYVMPDQIGDAGYVTLQQLRTLDRMGWDVSSHHAVPFTDFSDAALEPTLSGVRRALAKHGFARSAGHLAYPLGRHDPKRVLPVTRRVFETARIAGAGPETLPPGDPYRLRVINVLGSTTPEELRGVADAAIAHHHWAILMFHHLVPGPPENDLEYRYADFDEALELIRDSRVAVRTVSEVWRRYGCQPVAKADRPPTP